MKVFGHTCCERRRSSTETAAFSCHQQQQQTAEGRIWNCPWKTGRSETEKTKRHSQTWTKSNTLLWFYLSACCAQVFCLIQLKHGLQLCSAPHVAHEEVPDTDQIGGPRLLQPATASSQRKAPFSKNTSQCFTLYLLVHL